MRIPEFNIQSNGRDVNIGRKSVCGRRSGPVRWRYKFGRGVNKCNVIADISKEKRLPFSGKKYKMVIVGD